MGINKIKEVAQKTIKLEADAIAQLVNYIDSDFVETVEAIYNSKGRVILTGIGKSANIANKIVATLNSTGTPAIFMHAADAIHGDLGIIQPDDIIICISKSGNTPEIKVLAPLIKNFGNTLVAMVSNVDSYLAQKSDFILKAIVSKEACPNNLAPTSSTTAQLVIGDALAMSLLKMRGFTSEDFAKVHPGGALGKKLYTTIGDLLLPDLAPKVFPETGVREIIFEISSKRLGATAVVDQEDNIIGLITDGDLRRMLQNNKDVSYLVAKDIMTRSPKVLDCEELAINAFSMMEEHNITQVVVLRGNKYAGMVHLHDILREGIA